MRFEVIYTDKVRVQLDDLLEYIEAEFGHSVAVKFYKEFKDAVRVISHLPYLHPSMDGQGTRRCIIMGKSVMLYEIVDRQVRILSLRDARQDWKP
ncbi:MAG: type II toxin-antitoxin system RelE/ParE family toxin [Bacteroidia bacterium]